VQECAKVADVKKLQNGQKQTNKNIERSQEVEAAGGAARGARGDGKREMAAAAVVVVVVLAGEEMGKK